MSPSHSNDQTRAAVTSSVSPPRTKREEDKDKTTEYVVQCGSAVG